jgi:hypothetical protein
MVGLVSLVSMADPETPVPPGWMEPLAPLESLDPLVLSSTRRYGSRNDYYHVPLQLLICRIAANTHA